MTSSVPKEALEAAVDEAVVVVAEGEEAPAEAEEEGEAEGPFGEGEGEASVHHHIQELVAVSCSLHTPSYLTTCLTHTHTSAQFQWRL